MCLHLLSLSRSDQCLQRKRLLNLKQVCLEQLQLVDHFLVNQLLLKHQQAYSGILPSQANNLWPLQYQVAYLVPHLFRQVVYLEPLQPLNKNPYLVLK